MSYFLLLVSGVGAINYFAKKQAKESLDPIIKRVNEDLHFENGKWDTSFYNADPLIPGTSVLYVITTEG